MLEQTNLLCYFLRRHEARSFSRATVEFSTFFSYNSDFAGDFGACQDSLIINLWELLRNKNAVSTWRVRCTGQVRLVVTAGSTWLPAGHACQNSTKPHHAVSPLHYLQLFPIFICREHAASFWWSLVAESPAVRPCTYI